MSNDATIAVEIPASTHRPTAPAESWPARLRLRLRRRPDHALRDWELHDPEPAERLADHRAEVAFRAVRGL